MSDSPKMRCGTVEGEADFPLTSLGVLRADYAALLNHLRVWIHQLQGLLYMDFHRELQESAVHVDGECLPLRFDCLAIEHRDAGDENSFMPDTSAAPLIHKGVGSG